MADLEPIGPLVPTLPPAKGKDERRSPGRRTENPAGKDEGEDEDEDEATKRRKPDGSTHQVDEYA